MCEKNWFYRTWNNLVTNVISTWSWCPWRIYYPCNYPVLRKLCLIKIKIAPNSLISCKLQEYTAFITIYYGVQRVSTSAFLTKIKRDELVHWLLHTLDMDYLLDSDFNWNLTVLFYLFHKFYMHVMQIRSRKLRLTTVGDPPRWPRDIPLSTKVDTKFRRQVAVAQSV
jgi:hypothetical protein